MDGLSAVHERAADELESPHLDAALFAARPRGIAREQALAVGDGFKRCDVDVGGDAAMVDINATKCVADVAVGVSVTPHTVENGTGGNDVRACHHC